MYFLSVRPVITAVNILPYGTEKIGLRSKRKPLVQNGGHKGELSMGKVVSRGAPRGPFRGCFRHRTG